MSDETGRPTKRGGATFGPTVSPGEAELKLRLLVENVHDVAIFLMDPDGIITSWNAAAEKMKGFSAEEAIGSHYRMLYLPEDAALGKPEEHLRLAREQGKFSEKGYRARKNSTPFWAQVIVTPLWDDRGRFQGFAKITHDRSAEKVFADGQAQQVRVGALGVEVAALLGRSAGTRDTLQRFTELLAHHLEGTEARLWTLNEARGALELQAAASSGEHQGPECETPAGELRLGPVTDASRPGLRSEAALLVEESSRAWSAECGRSACTSLPLVVDERLVGMLAVFAAEPLAPEFQVGLAVIAEGVAQFLERKHIEDQLQDRVQELADANRRKDEFLAMLAHELRNPLAPIRNAVQLMRLQDGTDPKLRRAQDVIDRQVAQMSRLLDDLLEVSRVTRGRFELRREPLDLRGVIHNAVQTCRPTMDGRRHEFSLTLPGRPVPLTADPARLEQVLVNLLNNAAKYTEPGGRIWLTLEVAPASADQPVREAVVRVRDTGIGIDGKTLPHIFDLFVQADRPLDRSQGGLGIGLTIVHRVVTMHGGTIAAHSAGLGHGSEFEIRLPLDEQPEREAVVHPPAAARHHGRSLRILVVDDNADAADTLAELIPLWGHQARVAYNGTGALETIDGFRPDVLLLDIGLPGMDGYELARRLRDDLQLTDACYVALSGYGRDEDRRVALEAGFDRHLTKPIDPEALRSVLDRVSAS